MAQNNHKDARYELAIPLAESSTPRPLGPIGKTVCGGLVATMLGAGCATYRAPITKPDFDGDGVPDAVELERGTNPYTRDEGIKPVKPKQETTSVPIVPDKKDKDDIETSVGPQIGPDGAPIVGATVAFSWGSLKEIPVKFVKGAGTVIGRTLRGITQPIHPWHYERDDNGKVVVKNGKRQKYWAPFWRLWGERQGDSVVGLAYDKRYSNGLFGSHWFAGYGGRGVADPLEDKAGKLAGAFLLYKAGEKVFSDDDGPVLNLDDNTDGESSSKDDSNGDGYVPPVTPVDPTETWGNGTNAGSYVISPMLDKRAIIRQNVRRGGYRR